MKKKCMFLFLLLLFSIIVISIPHAQAQCTQEQRSALSEEMLAEIVKVNGPPQPISNEEKVAQVFYSLVPYTKRNDVKYRLSVIESNDVNAYALPDGRVIVFTGLLKSLPKDDLSPFAFVAAHEISHIEKRHAERKFQNKLTTGIIITLLVRNSSDWIRLLGGVAHGLITSGYSRDKENEADQGGLELMRAGNFDPNGALVTMKLFEDLQKRGKGLRVFPSHPMPSDRYKNIASWITSQGLAVSVFQSPIASGVSTVSHTPSVAVNPSFTSTPIQKTTVSSCPSPAVGVDNSPSPSIHTSMNTLKESSLSANKTYMYGKGSPQKSSGASPSISNMRKNLSMIILKDRKGNKYQLATYFNVFPVIIYYWSKPGEETKKHMRSLQELSEKQPVQPIAVQIDAESRKEACHMLLNILPYSLRYPQLIDIKGNFCSSYCPESKCGIILFDCFGREKGRWDLSTKNKEYKEDLKTAISEIYEGNKVKEFNTSSNRLRYIP